MDVKDKSVFQPKIPVQVMVSGPIPDPDVHACVNVPFQGPQEFAVHPDDPTHLPINHQE